MNHPKLYLRHSTVSCHSKLEVIKMSHDVTSPRLEPRYRTKHLAGERRLSCASPRFDRAAPTIHPATYRFRFIMIQRLSTAGSRVFAPQRADIGTARIVDYS